MRVHLCDILDAPIGRARLDDAMHPSQRLGHLTCYATCDQAAMPRPGRLAVNVEEPRARP